MTEVRVDSLSAGDCLILKTRSSIYEVEILNPQRQRARLTRVARGSGWITRDVCLTGAPGDDLAQPCWIRIGKALSYIYSEPEFPSKPLRGVSSRILAIGLSRAGRDGSSVAARH